MNELGMSGIEFVEFASANPESLDRLFVNLGFSKTMRHKTRAIDLYVQNEIVFLLNRESGSFGARFAKAHGPSICSMGWRFRDPSAALETIQTRGAREAGEGDYLYGVSEPLPAVFGIGDSLIYLTPQQTGERFYERLGFEKIPGAEIHPTKGFTAIDHLTNNVPAGTMTNWADFYKKVFDFSEVRYFDIRGVKTGLQSYALRSPCGKFCIPINEAKEEKSQINEYLREYGGPGIQHLAFLTDDILTSVEALAASGVQTLDMDEAYYEEAFRRVPGVLEERERIRRLNVLVDGDAEGYLLQIFTKNVVGPIFIEVIQRRNHLSFGEGNFGALFRSIERDQEQRGVFASKTVPSR